VDLRNGQLGGAMNLAGDVAERTHAGASHCPLASLLAGPYDSLAAPSKRANFAPAREPHARELQDPRGTRTAGP
jgi:hypothetical protein